MKRVLSVVLLSTGLVTACDKSREDKNGAAPKPSSISMSLPHLFRGTLPCGDCGGIDTHLELRSDHSFLLEERYLSRSMQNNRHSYTLGRFSQDGNILRLDHSLRGPLFFSIVSPREIKMLDQNGHDIDSQLNYRLRDSDSAVIPTGHMRLRGHFVKAADDGIFTECESGSRWQLNNAELDESYEQLGAKEDTPLFATLEAHLVKQAAADSGGKVDVMVVDRVVSTAADLECKPRPL